MFPEPSGLISYHWFHLLVGLCFGWLPCSSLFKAAPAAAEQAALQRNEEGEQHNHDEEGDDIQGVVLDPVQVVSCRSQVRGPFVSHYKLHPVHSQVQGVDGSVEVKVGEALDVLFVPVKRRCWVFSGTCDFRSPQKKGLRCQLCDGPVGTSLMVFPHCCYPMKGIMAKLWNRKSLFSMTE